jgi:hypothetical protein
MRNLILAGVLLLGGIFIVLRLAEVQQVAETLRKGDWRFIGMGLILELLWMVTIAASYKVIYHAMSLPERIERLLLISLSATFVNVVAPSIGMGGMAIFISEARRKGYSTGRVTAAGVLFVLLDYFGFLGLLVIGLFVLFRRGQLSSPEIIASGLLLAVALLLAYLVYIGLRSSEALGEILGRLAGLVNRILTVFKRPNYLSKQRAYQFAQETSIALNELIKKPYHLSAAVGLALLTKVILLCILLMMFLAFGTEISIGTLVAGFSIGYLFLIVSPTPAGVGFVEGGLALALTSLSVPLGAAAVITLAYRGITFWLPLLLGMLAFRILPHTSEVRTPA